MRASRVPAAFAWAARTGLVLVLLCACETPKDRRDKERARPRTVPTAPPLVPAETWSPPADWDTMPAAAFEERVLVALSEERETPLAETALLELATALDRMDASSVRAAVLLGRSRTDEAGEVLWARLRKRELGPERQSDAGDVVAAAALGRFPRPYRWWRIVRLVDGTDPHPDLEVRVECACTALSSGFDRVIPFLLQVLRIGTWEGQADEWAFPLPETTAWARGRAAEALSARAGVPVTYHADAPLTVRQREARALEELLAPAIVAR